MTILRVLLPSLLLTCLTAGIVTPARSQPDPHWQRHARQPHLTPLQKQVYEQMALLREQTEGFDSPPARTLAEFGLDALLPLSKGLGDATPTRSRILEYSKPPKRLFFQVNEIIVGVIDRIARHTFVVPFNSSHAALDNVVDIPELAPTFRAAIARWYQKNWTRTLAQRKVADVSDSWFRNRRDAAQWIGQNKPRGGRAALEGYITTLLTQKSINTTKDLELATAALGLGQIGDPSARAAVQQVCEHFAGYARDAHNTRRHFTDYIAPRELFTAYQGLALLGGKRHAMRQLRTLYATCAPEMRKEERQEFARQLKAAEKW